MTPSQKTACVEIGGIPIGLTTSSDLFYSLLQERYIGFLSSVEPEFELEFELKNELVVSEIDVRVHRDENDWLIERGDFHARLNLETKHGTVVQTVNPYALDSLIRILHSLILAGRGGFLLHAASASVKRWLCRLRYSICG